MILKHFILEWLVRTTRDKHKWGEFFPKSWEKLSQELGGVDMKNRDLGSLGRKMFIQAFIGLCIVYFIKVFILG